MLQKHAKPLFNFKKLLVKGGIILLAIEGTCFVACYGVWTKLNSDRDFRNTVRQKFPIALNAYYKVGETLGSGNTRLFDYECWQKEGKLHDR